MSPTHVAAAVARRQALESGTFGSFTHAIGARADIHVTRGNSSRQARILRATARTR